MSLTPATRAQLEHALERLRRPSLPLDNPTIERTLIEILQALLEPPTAPPTSPRSTRPARLEPLACGFIKASEPQSVTDSAFNFQTCSAIEGLGLRGPWRFSPGHS